MTNKASNFWVFFFFKPCPLACRILIPNQGLNLGNEAPGNEGFPGSSVGEESVWNVGDPDSIPGSGRCPGEGNGNPLQYSCLENPMDRGTWQATVHGVSRVRHWLSDHHHQEVKAQSPNHWTSRKFPSQPFFIIFLSYVPLCLIEIKALILVTWVHGHCGS